MSHTTPIAIPPLLFLVVGVIAAIVLEKHVLLIFLDGIGLFFVGWLVQLALKIPPYQLEY